MKSAHFSLRTCQPLPRKGAKHLPRSTGWVRPCRTAAGADKKHRHLEMTGQVKSGSLLASPLTQSVAATTSAPPKEIWFWKTYVFARDYYKERLCPCPGHLAGKGWDTLENHIRMPPCFSHLVHKRTYHNEDTSTETNWKGTLRTFSMTLNFWIAFPLGKSSVIHKQIDSREDWWGRWGQVPSLQGAMGRE